MTDEQFKNLCNTYGFAPSRSLRELLDSATAQAVISERQACAKVCDSKAAQWSERSVPLLGYSGELEDCAAAIRARSQS
jgi:hypothetical protein